ncbi:MAG: hypothetical protein ABWY49_01420 [Rhizobium sp.]
MSDVRDETKPEQQTNVVWLQKREQLINENQTALSKYLIARREAKKSSP